MDDERMDPTPGPRELESIARLIAEQIEARERMELRMRLERMMGFEVPKRPALGAMTYNEMRREQEAEARERARWETMREQWADKADR